MDIHATFCTDPLENDVVLRWPDRQTEIWTNKPLVKEINIFCTYYWADIDGPLKEPNFELNRPGRQLLLYFWNKEIKVKLIFFTFACFPKKTNYSYLLLSNLLLLTVNRQLFFNKHCQKENGGKWLHLQYHNK